MNENNESNKPNKPNAVWPKTVYKIADRADITGRATVAGAAAGTNVDSKRSVSVAIITGASSGLGREFARQIDQLDNIDEIWLMARRQNLLEALTQELKHKCLIIPGDIQREATEEALLTKLTERNVKVKILVNSAGMGKNELFQETSLEVNSSMIDLNARSLTRFCYLVLPFMQSGACIFNIASVSAFMPQYKFAVYAATKSYVLSFSRALNAELRDKNILVMAVCPNPMQTEFFPAGKGPEGLKKLGLEDVSDVVRQALRRAKLNKDISVFSFPAKFVHVMAKIIPHRWILFFERVNDKAKKQDKQGKKKDK